MKRDRITYCFYMCVPDLVAGSVVLERWQASGKRGWRRPLANPTRQGGIAMSVGPGSPGCLEHGVLQA